MLWRITGKRFAKTAREAFSGEGGRLFAGRWHAGGLPIVYAASSFSLAQLETLVHTTNPTLLPALLLVRAELPDALATHRVDAKRLPADWVSHPAPLSLQKVGQDWLIARSSVALLVPSALSPNEFNILLNPLHPDFVQLVLAEPPEPYSPDPRLLGPAKR